MSQPPSLREAERRVFRSSFQDGLPELMLGAIVSMFAIAPYLSPYLGDFWSSAVFVPFWAAAFGLLWLVRRQIVRPRVGMVEFADWRRTRLMRFSAGMLLAGILALILGILSALRFEAVPGWMHTARFSLIILLGFCAAAYFLDFPGLYGYGTLIALAPVAGEGLYALWQVPHHGFPVTFGFSAALMAVVGLLKLARLVRTYPQPGDGASLESPANG